MIAIEVQKYQGPSLILDRVHRKRSENSQARDRISDTILSRDMTSRVLADHYDPLSIPPLSFLSPINQCQPKNAPTKPSVRLPPLPPPPHPMHKQITTLVSVTPAQALAPDPTSVLQDLSFLSPRPIQSPHRIIHKVRRTTAKSNRSQRRLVAHASHSQSSCMFSSCLCCCSSRGTSTGW